MNHSQRDLERCFNELCYLHEGEVLVFEYRGVSDSVSVWTSYRLGSRVILHGSKLGQIYINRPESLSNFDSIRIHGRYLLGGERLPSSRDLITGRPFEQLPAGIHKPTPAQSVVGNDKKLKELDESLFKVETINLKQE